MITFLSLWEQMQSDEDSPLHASESSSSLQTIRAGLDMRGDDARRTFWDDFIQMCNNSAGMAELLGVSQEQVSKWTPRIKELLERVRKEDDQQTAGEKNLIPTGDEGSNGSFGPTMNPF